MAKAIDWKNWHKQSFWQQVKDFTEKDFRELSRDDRLMLTPEYKRYQTVKCHEIFERVRGSELLTEARRYWPLLSLEEKTPMLQEIADIHAEVHQYKPCSIKMFKAKPDRKKIAGYYEWSGDTLFINKNHSCIRDFKQASNTVIHEATHALQDYMGRSFLNQKITLQDPLFPQAEIFMRGYKMYIDSKINSLLYCDNPLEKDAFEQGGLIGCFIGSSDEDRAFLVNTIADIIRLEGLRAAQVAAPQKEELQLECC